MGRRTQAERDAVTVEIGYAVVSGALVAGATFAGIFAPALLFDLTPAGEHLLFRIGAIATVPVFAARVVHVLWRFPRIGRSLEGRRMPPAQPSQPGRTSPDS
jgi:hypothetical protein